MATKSVPGSVRVSELVRLDILEGRWQPGQKLQPAELEIRYETSTTVIREALTRLAGDKLVTIEPNRGFFVQKLSLTEVRDVTEVRCTTEALALSLAIERGDMGWESELVAEHYKLSKTPRRVAGHPNETPQDWARAHRAFHSKLIEACGVPVLIDLARQLSDATELYRRWAARSDRTDARDVEKEHADLLSATLARNAPLATSLLRTHFETTATQLLNSDIFLRAHAKA